MAYIGVRAGATIAVVDGKEGPPFTSIVSNKNQGIQTTGRRSISASMVRGLRTLDRLWNPARRSDRCSRLFSTAYQAHAT